jgi:ribonuclease D
MPKSRPKPIPSKTETALLAPFACLTLDRIVVPNTIEGFASACAEIKAAGQVGFDTESKPVFLKDVISDGPHVVQFAMEDKAFIFQLHHADCHPFLIELLQSESVVKVGFGLGSDQSQIHHKLGVKLRAVIDLSNAFKGDGYRGSIGVRVAVAIVFQQKFHKSKRVTTSNWALPQLSDRQILYAANDAYAALRVQHGLQANLFNAGACENT